MPWLGRQCRTTVSPGLTVVTPGPTSMTRAEASCPSRCGKKLSGPLTASISLICAPQIELNSTFTSTCPASSASGSVISSRTSGLRDSARMAALVFLICICGPLLEIDEFVVAERISVLGAMAKQMRTNFRFGIGEAVARNVEAGNLGPRQQLLELVEKVALAAAHVEDFGIALQSVDVDERLRDRSPASLDE